MGITYCAVVGCNSKKYGNKAKSDLPYSFFSLPREKARRFKWLKQIGRPDLINDQTKPKCYFVCSKHFAKSDIINVPHLVPTAMPTKYCPSAPPESNSNQSSPWKSPLKKTYKKKDPQIPIDNPDSSKTDNVEGESKPDPLKIVLHSEFHIKQEIVSQDNSPEDETESRMTKLREKLHSVKDEVMSDDELEHEPKIKIELIELKTESPEE